MKVSELKQKTENELADLLKEKRERVDELRWQVSQKKVKNVKEIMAAKKDIARILTLINE